MIVRIQVRRDTAVNWASNNPILASGEFGYETDTETIKIGNGADAWNDLAYLQGSGGGGEIDGLSAYEIAVQNGFAGTEQEWLTSLQGVDGIDGTNGIDGDNGVDGATAYQIAVNNGYVGTEEEWIESLSPVRYMDGDIFDGDGETPETKTTIKDGSIEEVKLSAGLQTKLADSTNVPLQHIIKPSYKTVYVSNLGDDVSSGDYKSPISSLSKLSEIQTALGANEYLRAYLNRGDLFRETFEIVKGGRDNDLRTIISAYGDNENLPIIDGSVDLSALTWANVSGSIWKAPLSTPVKAVWKAGVLMTLARNPTEFTISSVGANTVTSDALIGHANGRYIGAFMDTKKYDWQPIRLLITDFDGATGTLTYANSIQGGPVSADYKFILDNLYEFLDGDDEWYYNSSTNEIFYHHTSNPNTLNLVGAVRSYGLFQGETYGGSSISNLLIEDVKVQYTALEGIRLIGDVRNTTIQRTTVHDCIRFGISLEGRTTPEANSNNEFLSNEIKRTSAGGLAVSRILNSKVNRNVIEEVATDDRFYGYYDPSNNSYLTFGGGISNVGFTGEGEGKNEFSYNKIKGTGKNGMDISSSNNLVTFNEVSEFGKTSNDVGGIYLFGAWTTKNYIANNLVKDHLAATYLSPVSTIPFGVGLYKDNECSDNLFYNNTVIKCTHGSVDNWNGKRNSTIKNKFINNGTAILVNNRSNEYVLDLNISENIIVLLKYNQKAFSYSGFFASTVDFNKGLIDNNKYYLVGNTSPFSYDFSDLLFPVRQNFPFRIWKGLSGFDTNSSMYDISSEIEEYVTATVVQDQLNAGADGTFETGSFPNSYFTGSVGVSMEAGLLDGNSIRVQNTNALETPSLLQVTALKTFTQGNWYRIKFSSISTKEHYIRIQLAYESDPWPQVDVAYVGVGLTRKEHTIYYQHKSANFTESGSSVQLWFRVYGGVSSEQIDLEIDNLEVDEVTISAGHNIEDNTTNIINSIENKNALFSGESSTDIEGNTKTSVVVPYLGTASLLETPTNKYLIAD